MSVNLPVGSRTERIASAADRMAAWLGRHWLAVFNVVVGVFVMLPFLAPLLMHLGASGNCPACTGAGRVIYAVYTPTCHQLPERSFFVFGPRLVYSEGELEAAGLVPPGLNILQREMLRLPGRQDIGYKVAVCERDVAIYGSILLAGLIFGAVRSFVRRAGRPIPRLPLWAYALLLVPIAIDGITQLIGLRESTWELRLLTGTLFGAATVWLSYPYVQEAMDDVVRTAGRKQPSPLQRDP